MLSLRSALLGLACGISIVTGTRFLDYHSVQIIIEPKQPEVATLCKDCSLFR